MALIADWKTSWRLHSVKVAGAGAIAGAVAAGLAASGAVLPWLGTLPTWVVFAGGALVCALTVFARLWKQS